MKAERRGFALLLERPCRAVLRNGALDRKEADIVNTIITKIKKDENAKGRSDKGRLVKVEALATESVLRNFYELPQSRPLSPAPGV